MNDETVKCDKCEKPAVVNFQQGTAQYNIVKGEYEWDGFEEEGGDNEHYCEEHRNDK